MSSDVAADDASSPSPDAASGKSAAPSPASPPHASDASDTIDVDEAKSGDASSAGRTLAAFIGPAMAWLEHAPRYRLARRVYHRNERLLPPTLFLGGVGWDAATLRRIDALVDNVILGTYLALLGLFIVLTTLKRNERPMLKPLEQLGQWSTGAIQFLAGGLFSAYVVYYTQSASLTTASLFLLILVAALVANEFIWDRTLNVYVLLGIYFLAVFCYFTFFLPIVFGTMGFSVFLVSGFLSAGVLGLIILFFERQSVFATNRGFLGAFGVVIGLLLMMNLFYVQNWIPPVPLALRHGGIYRDVAVQGDAYALRYRAEPWYKVWDDPDEEVFEYAPGDTVHAFTAVFAPTDLRTRIYHRWESWDADDEAWVGTDRIGYRVVGGRDNGYRGFTYKRNVHPGNWRVTVETEDERIVGRIRFSVAAADTSQAVEYGTKLYY